MVLWWVATATHQLGNQGGGGGWVELGAPKMGSAVAAQCVHALWGPTPGTLCQGPAWALTMFTRYGLRIGLVLGAPRVSASSAQVRTKSHSAVVWSPQQTHSPTLPVIPDAMTSQLQHCSSYRIPVCWEKGMAMGPAGHGGMCQSRDPACTRLSTHGLPMTMCARVTCAAMPGENACIVSTVHARTNQPHVAWSPKGWR